MKKKLLAMLLAVVMIAAMLPTAFAEDGYSPYGGILDLSVADLRPGSNSGGLTYASIVFEAARTVKKQVNWEGSWFGGPVDTTLVLVKPGSTVTLEHEFSSTDRYGFSGYRYLGDNQFVRAGEVTPAYLNPAAQNTITITVEEFFTGFDAIRLEKYSNGGFGVPDYIFIMLESTYDGTVPATPTEPETPKTSFNDLAKGAYYTDAVAWAVANKITTGTSGTTFSPDEPCTRGQVVTFLWRAYGSKEPTSAVSPFTDVNPGDYFYKAVLWAVENGIASGTDKTTFSPNTPCTRAQAVTFQHRAAGKPAVSGGSAFTDVNAGNYFADAVAWAVANKVTSGTSSTTFSPNESCTRGQIVTFLYRELGK